MNHTVYVIIPVYNAEKFVEAAVRSVQRRNGSLAHIVLVDDGSGDSSGAVCDRLCAENSRVHGIHQDNAGVSAARNAGIDYVFSRLRPADGDYFAFLDADDFWDPGVTLGSLDVRDADLVAFSSCLSNAYGDKFRIFHRFRDGVQHLEGANTLWINDGHFGAFLFRVGLVRQFRLRFMRDVRSNEDIIFWRQATFCAGTVVFFSKTLYCYRTNYASVTHNLPDTNMSTLHIPHAWNSAAAWVQDLPQFTPEQKQVWITECRNTAGARLLEAARILAEHGFSAQQLRTIILNGALSRCLTELDPDFLADWQKGDYALFREDLDAFAACYRRRGYLQSFRKELSRLHFLRALRERVKFHRSVP